MPPVSADALRQLRRAALGALLAVACAHPAPLSAPGPIEIDFNGHGRGPLSPDWFAPEGVRFTEGRFVTRGPAGAELTGPVAAAFREPVHVLELRLGASTNLPTRYTLVAYAEDGSELARRVLTHERKARRARRAGRAGGPGFELRELAHPVAAFTLDAELVEPRENGDRRAAFTLRRLRHCRIPEQPSALPPARRGCLRPAAAAERRHARAHLRFVEGRQEGEARAQRYAARDLDCASGQHPRLEVHGNPGDDTPRVGARCPGHQIRWYWHGQRESEMHTDAGQPLEWRTWHPNGQLSMRVAYRQGQRQGESLHWYADGTLSMEVEYADGEPIGAQRWYYPTGALGWEATHAEGVRHGPYRRWHENGALHLEGEYRHGEKHGVWNTRDGRGRLLTRERYEAGRQLETLSLPQLR